MGVGMFKGNTNEDDVEAQRILDEQNRVTDGVLYQENASTNNKDTWRKSKSNTDKGIKVYMPFQIEKRNVKLKYNGSVLKDIKHFCDERHEEEVEQKTAGQELHDSNSILEEHNQIERGEQPKVDKDRTVQMNACNSNSNINKGQEVHDSNSTSGENNQIEGGEQPKVDKDRTVEINACDSNSNINKDVPCITVLPDVPLVKICFQTFEDELKKENISLTVIPLEQVGTLNDDAYFIFVYMHDHKQSVVNLDDYLKFIGEDLLKRMALVVLYKEGSTYTRETIENSKGNHGIHSESAIREKEIFILDPSAAPASTQFVEQFQDKMKENGILIETIIIDDSKIALKPDAILILVCNTSSRIEADLIECFRHIRSEQFKQTVVLVLHVGSKSPNDSLKERIGNSSTRGKLDKVLGIVEMTFEMDTGIHNTNLNRKADKKLTTLLGKETAKLQN